MGMCHDGTCPCLTVSNDFSHSVWTGSKPYSMLFPLLMSSSRPNNHSVNITKSCPKWVHTKILQTWYICPKSRHYKNHFVVFMLDTKIRKFAFRSKFWNILKMTKINCRMTFSLNSMSQYHKLFTWYSIVRMHYGVTLASLSCPNSRIALRNRNAIQTFPPFTYLIKILPCFKIYNEK